MTLDSAQEARGRFVNPRSAAYGLLGLLAAFCLFFNLGDRLLWGDEAETALLALNITQYGVPKAFDGTNRITLLNERDWNQDEIWIWSPWLDEYVAAGSFAVLGRSTIAARLPFALMAFASIVLLGRVAYRAFRSHTHTLAVVFLYSTSVPFLLHSRQCRYYAVLMLAQVWLLYGFQEIERGRSWKGSIHIGLALSALFYSNYAVVPGNLLALALVAVLIKEDRWVRIRHLVAAAGLFAAICIPWLLYAEPSGQLRSFSVKSAAGSLAHYVGEINFHILPLVVLLVPALAWGTWRLTGRGKRPKPAFEASSSFALLLWLLPPCQLIVLSFAPLVSFRYLVPLIPVLMLLGTGILFAAVHTGWLRAGLIVLLASSNAVAFVSAYPWRGAHRLELTFPVVLKSIASDYTNGLEDLVNLIGSELEPGDSVYVADPEFPLIFYTGARVIDARFRRLSKIQVPDWILPRSPSAAIVEPRLRVGPNLVKSYRPVTVQIHASPPGDTRPDPHAYQAFTASKMEGFVLYRLRSDANPRNVSADEIHTTPEPRGAR